MLDWLALKTGYSYLTDFEQMLAKLAVCFGSCLALALLLLILMMFGVVPCRAQECIRQPPPASKALAEWACRGMPYDDAWGLLAANGVAPVRPAKVSEIASDINHVSRKTMLITGLRIASFGLPIIPALGAVTETWLQGLLAAGPALIDGGLKFAAGVPDEFRETPAESGFTTVYSLPTEKAVVFAAARPAPQPAAAEVPTFRPTAWPTALAEARARDAGPGYWWEWTRAWEQAYQEDRRGSFMNQSLAEEEQHQLAQR